MTRRMERGQKPDIDRLINIIVIGLKAHAAAVIRAAQTRGYISQSEIVDLLPEADAADPARLSRTVGSLRACLDTLGVALVTDERRRGIEHGAASRGTATAPPPEAEPKQRRTRKRRVKVTVEVEAKEEIDADGDEDVAPVDLRDREETPSEEKLDQAEHDLDEPRLGQELDRWESDTRKHTPPEVNLVRLYLKEIGRFPLLSRKEVKALAKRVFESGGEDIEARNKLAEHNLRLAVHLAKRRSFAGRRHSLDLLDLIQEANSGLLKGVEEYDYRLGYKLSTYATWWIRQKMRRAIDDEGYTVRVPVHRRELWRKIEGIRQKFISEFDREPTTKEISAATGLPTVKIEKALRELWSTPGYALPLLALDRPNAQLDTHTLDLVAHDDSQSVIPDTYHLTPEQKLLAEEELKRAVTRLRLMVAMVEQSRLKERDVAIFRAKYGLDDWSLEVRTLGVVGKTAGQTTSKPAGITRERVRQILYRKVWPLLQAHGFKKDEAWLEKEFERIHLLERLIGRETRES